MAKILHIHPNYNSAKKFVIPLIEIEIEEGHHSSLVFSTGAGDGISKKIKYDLTSDNIFGWLKGLFILYFYLLNHKPDIVFCHNSKASFFPLFFCYALRIKHRIYFNHGIPYVAYTFLIRFLLKTIEVSNLFFCTQALTVSDQSKEILNSLKSCKQVSLIGNGSACGIDLNRIDYLRINSSRNWRINNDFKPDDFLVAFIGRAEARKGFKKIIEMWTNFKFEKNFYLIICGPSYRDVERFGLVSNENMRVYGYVEDIFEILNEVDVVVLPSFHEGLPYVLLEAMAFGCVVIGNNTFGINALIRDGYNGYLVDNNNIQLFFEKIMYVYNHKSEMLNIKNNASSYIRQYDREIFFHSYRVFIGNLR